MEPPFLREIAPKIVTLFISEPLQFTAAIPAPSAYVLMFFMLESVTLRLLAFTQQIPEPER